MDLGGGRPMGFMTKRPEEEGKKAGGDRHGGDGDLFTEADPGESCQESKTQ